MVIAPTCNYSPLQDKTKQDKAHDVLQDKAGHSTQCLAGQSTQRTDCAAGSLHMNSQEVKCMQALLGIKILVIHQRPFQRKKTTQSKYTLRTGCAAGSLRRVAIRKGSMHACVRSQWLTSWCHPLSTDWNTSLATCKGITAAATAAAATACR
jgi:hypothetical protein